jgi:putative ABC transport system permease protein
MTWLRIFIQRLRGVFFKRKLERDLEDEIRSHLEMQIEENVRRGMSPEEARHAARRKFGGVEQVKEAYRDGSGLPLVESTLQDLRYAVRTLAKNPGFSLIAIIILALGIGANTAIFSAVSAVLLRPLPYPEPDRLVMVWERHIKEDLRNVVSVADFCDWRERNRVFENIAAQIGITVDLTEGGEPERIGATGVSPSYFDVLGVKPMLGRSFLPEEELPGAANVAVINHTLWQRRFGADRSIIGRTISLSGESYEVIGVLPSSSRYGNEDLGLWVPLKILPQARQNRLRHSLRVVARIKSGITLQQARADMERVSAELMREYPAENTNHTAFVIPLHAELVSGEGVDIRQPLLILFAAAGLVLAVACANVANLQLIRAAARRKEIAIRAALGARPRRIARQLLTESMLLAALGGAVGTLLAYWGIAAITALIPQRVLHLTGSPRLDLRILGFTLVISLGSGVLSGLGALRRASRPNLTDTLREGGGGSGVATNRARSMVVVAEIALAVVLLIGAGLMIRTLWNIQHVQLGFDPRDVVTAQIVLPSARYPQREEMTRFFQQLSERVRALPGVQAVGAISRLPLTGGYGSTSIAIEGRAEMINLLPQARPRIYPRTVTPDYFQAMGIPLLKGRFMTAKDAGNAPLVVLINQTAATRYWPGGNPLGQRVQIGGGNPWKEVIGIVGDAKHRGGLDQDILPEVYFPWAQYTQSSGTMVVRGTNVSSLAPAIRSKAQELDRLLPISNVRTLEEIVEGSIAAPRTNTLLLALFAGIALALAAVGIYGVMAYSVAQRAHEIGVRMALGAQSSDALKLVLKQGMILALVGALIGLIASWGLTRLMESLLFGVGTTDPLTFILIPLLLILVALLACWLPARRATKVDPLVVLRNE